MRRSRHIKVPGLVYCTVAVVYCGLVLCLTISGQRKILVQSQIKKKEPWICASRASHLKLQRANSAANQFISFSKQGGVDTHTHTNTQAQNMWKEEHKKERSKAIVKSDDYLRPRLISL